MSENTNNSNGGAATNTNTANENGTRASSGGARSSHAGRWSRGGRGQGRGGRGRGQGSRQRRKQETKKIAELEDIYFSLGEGSGGPFAKERKKLLPCAGRTESDLARRCLEKMKIGRAHV